MSENINRAFMYGESVFSTLRMIDGRLLDWDYHFDRLRRGVEFIYGPFTDGDDWPMLLKERIESRLLAESGDRVIRITVFREQARGLIRSNLISVSGLRIQVNASSYDPQRSEGKMLSLRTCAAPLRPHWWPGYLKAGDYLETILCQKIFMKPGDDDILFLSQNDTVLESSVANIFVVRHNKLFTAPVGPNVLDGVMRRKVMEHARTFFDDCEESETTIEQLFKADAVFGTNSVRGPFLIARIDDREYSYDQDFLSKFENLRKRVLA